MAHQISELVCTFKREANQNKDGTSSIKQKFVQPNNDRFEGCIEPRYTKLNFPHWLQQSTWMTCCKQFFHNQWTMEADKVSQLPSILVMRLNYGYKLEQENLGWHGKCSKRVATCSLLLLCVEFLGGFEPIVSWIGRRLSMPISILISKSNNYSNRSTSGHFYCKIMRLFGLRWN